MNIRLRCHAVPLFYECRFCSDRSQLGRLEGHRVDERMLTAIVANQKGIAGSKEMDNDTYQARRLRLP